MSDNVFSNVEQAVINAIKAQTLVMIQNKQMFWNGVETDCVIAGGVFASLINDEAIKDIDVFILNKNVSVYAHLTDNARNSDPWVIRDRGAANYLKNPHIHGTAFNTKTKVQYILTDYTSREQLLKDFDYKHTTVSYVPKEMKLYITRGAFDAIRNKHLIVNGDNKAQHWRQSKFENRGWKMAWTATQHHQGLTDSYQATIQQSVADMIKRINQQKGMLPTLDEKDIDIEAFQQLIK